MLHNVGKFMRKQVTACCGLRGISSNVKRHVVTDRVGLSIYRPCRLCCVRVKMHTDMTEVVAKASLHVMTYRRFQRSAWISQNAVYASGIVACLCTLLSCKALKFRDCITGGVIRWLGHQLK